MPSNKRFFATMVAIIKDEAPYLAEWLEYHTLQGIEHAYVYDNGSSDGSAEILADYVRQGRVTLIDWPEYPGQLSAYNHAVHVFGRDSEWMAIIDIDEFIFPSDGRRFTDTLAILGEGADQLLLPWMHFGSSGHDDQPDGLVIENYVHRSTDIHAQTKAVIRPEAVSFVGIHHCETRSRRTIDSAGAPAEERWMQLRPIAADIRVNHYFTKSRAEFTAKISRGQSDGGTGKTIADFMRFETPLFDDGIAAFGPRIRAAIAETRARPRKLFSHAPWSAQSELTPSQVWVTGVNRAIKALRASLPADAAPAIRVDNARGSIQGIDLPAASVTAAFDDVAAMVEARPNDLSALALDVEHIIDVAGPAKPYLAWWGEASTAGTLRIDIVGNDAGGKPWVSQRELAVAPGGNLLFAILSERTMSIRTIRFIPSPGAGIVCHRAALYSFV